MQAASEIVKAKNRHSERRRIAFFTQGLRKAVEGRLVGNPSRTNAKPIQCACGALLVKTPHPASTSQTRASRVRHQSRSSYGALRGRGPFEGVAQDAQRLALRGRLSPTESATLRYAKMVVDYVAITWLSTATTKGSIIAIKSLRKMVDAEGFEPTTR